MSDDYTPEAGGAREDLTYPWEGLNPGRRGRLAAFVRWMVEHDRQVAVKALQEVVLDICHDPRTDLTNQSHSLAVISAHLELLTTEEANRAEEN